MAHAVVQVHPGRQRGRGLHRLQPGHERRGANACGHPHLLGGAVAAKVKAAIRPLDAHRLARLHLQGQLPRVVAQRLDGKPQHAVALVGVEQGEGVRPLGTAKGDKRKLTGRMLPATGGADLAGHFQHPSPLGRHAHHTGRMAAAAPDGPGQRAHCAQHPHQRAQAHQHTRRLLPPSGRREHHSMEGQHQVHHGQQLVQVAPHVVRKPLPQRDDQHGREEPHGPFPHLLGQVAEGVQPPIRARRAHRAAYPVSQQAARQLQPVVQQRQHNRADTRPLVQAVALVQATERLFQPRGPHGQHHDQRHQRPGCHPGEQDQLVTPPPDIAPRGRCRLGHDQSQHPHAHGHRQSAPQNLLPHHQPH